MQSRLLSYRTYNKEEYQQMASWLLANNYHSTAKYDFKEAQHTIYSNGTFSIKGKGDHYAAKERKNVYSV